MTSELNELLHYLDQDDWINGVPLDIAKKAAELLRAQLARLEEADRVLRQSRIALMSSHPVASRVAIEEITAWLKGDA